MTMTMGAANNSAVTGPPPEGTYIVELKLIEEQPDSTKYSPDGQFRWIMTIKSVQFGDDEAEAYVGEELWGYSNMIPKGYGTKSKTRQWWEAFAGRELDDGEEMTAEPVLRKKAVAHIVEYVKEDGKTKSTKIDRLSRMPKKGKPVPKPEPDEDVEEDDSADLDFD